MAITRLKVIQGYHFPYQSIACINSTNLRPISQHFEDKTSEITVGCRQGVPLFKTLVQGEALNLG